jgi:hypothetical protein
MKLPGILTALLGLILSCTPLLKGQASQSTPTVAPTPDVYPDQGYLSPTRYVSRYFGFAFDLPPNAQLAPVPQAVGRDGRVQILQLGGPPPAYATVSIVAFPSRMKSPPDSKTILRKALDQELYKGVEELHGLSKTTLAGHLFYFFETRRGADQHMALACNLEGYVVVVMLAANNEKTVKELETSFQHLTFIAPAKLHEFSGADATEYEGPAISSHHLALLQADPPANHIDVGSVTRNVYENPGLGFSYRIPSGWTLEGEGAVQPAIERSHRKTYDDPWMGAGERELMKVCSRTLFSVWAKRPAADGQLSYDDFGEVTVSATSMACFPGVKLPNSTDRRAIQDFLLQLRLTHPILENMRDAKAFTSGGNLVIFLHGTVAFQVPGDELSRRLSIAMTVTSRRGYLLTWFFAAPHDSELKDLLEERLAFDPEPPSQEASTTKPGGANITPANALSAPAPARQAVSDPAQAAGAGSQPEDSASNTDSAATAAATQQPDAPAATSSSRPSLLRPGETTMQEQQAKGQPTAQKH